MFLLKVFVTSATCATFSRYPERCAEPDHDTRAHLRAISDLDFQGAVPGSEAVPTAIPGAYVHSHHEEHLPQRIKGAKGACRWFFTSPYAFGRRKC